MATSIHVSPMALHRRPPPFQHIIENAYIHRRSSVAKFSVEEADICQCSIDNGLACTESCLNRSLFTECVSGTCPCGEACQNQRLQKRQWAKTSLQYFGEKGWGVVAEEPLTAGQLVVEYIGEVCDLKEVERRAQHYEKLGLKNTYIMNLNPSEVIDATRYGNYSRFINHSCDPNSECQKWTVKGEQRIAIFASRDIAIGEEITYNYNLDWNGGRRVKCQCGSDNCSGYLGAESVLWRKTIHANPKKRLLFSECLTGSESMDFSHEGLSSTGSCADGMHDTSCTAMQRHPMPLPYQMIMTRSKVSPSRCRMHSRQRVLWQTVGSASRSPSLIESSISSKRRKLVNGAEPNSVTPKPRSLPNKAVPQRRESRRSAALYSPPEKQYPLFVMQPLPQKFTFSDPPTMARTVTGFHPSLLSVTDTVPLPQLVGDPFLIWNQEYYMTIGDVLLNGLVLSNDAKCTKDSET